MPDSLPLLILLCCYLLLITNCRTEAVDPDAADPNVRVLRFEPSLDVYTDQELDVYTDQETRFVGEYRSVVERQLLGPFQLCLACECCAAGTPTPTCATMPCCFAIDCRIPGKAFGVCAFMPKTCNCTSCGA